MDAGDVVLIGGSMGASTIWAYIDQCGTSRLRGIVTMDQTPKMSNEAGWDHGYYGFGSQNLGTFLPTVHPTPGKAPNSRKEEILSRPVDQDYLGDCLFVGVTV